MEFDNLGRRCAYEGCNQKDFLPFKCDMCQLDLCLIHRTYIAHNCVKAAGKDFTSVDCPICNKGFKLSRADDPNEAWESHYANDCTQRSGPAKAKPVTCPVALCRTILGPSNTFVCTKCQLKVCLTHRIPEEHLCKSIVSRKKETMINARTSLVSSASTSKAAPTSQSGSSSSSTTKNKNAVMARKTADQGNSIYGTTDRRKRNEATPFENRNNDTANTHSSGAGGGLCPICNIYFEEQDLLVTHVNVEHLETFGVPTASSSAASSVPLNEPCPFCSERFSDAVCLVGHVQSKHPEKGSGQQRSSTNQCSLC